MLKNRFVLTALAAGILAVPAVSADAPGYWKVPGTDTQMQVYGRLVTDVVLDTVHPGGVNTGMSDFVGTKSDDALPKNIWDMTANDSRLGTRTITSTDGGDVKTRVEFDFTAATYAAHLRQFYAEMGGFLAGKTDTNFFDPDETIEYLDEDGLLADYYAPGRFYQLRYSGDINKQTSYAISVEKNIVGIGANAAATNPAIDSTNTLPGAVIGRLHYADAWGHIDGAFAYQKANNFITTATGTRNDSLNVVSFTLGGHFQFGKDALGWRYGNGTAGYGAGMQDEVLYDVNNNLTSIRSNQYEAGYTHVFTDKVRGNLVGSLVTTPEDVSKGNTGAQFKSYTQAGANVIVDVNKVVSYGFEYMYGVAKTFSAGALTNPDGSTTNTAHESKLHFQFKVKFF